MLEIILGLGVTGISMYLLFKFLKLYEEAKEAGYIYDDKKIDD